MPLGQNRGADGGNVCWQVGKGVGGSKGVLVCRKQVLGGQKGSKRVENGSWWVETGPGKSKRVLVC